MEHKEETTYSPSSSSSLILPYLHFQSVHPFAELGAFILAMYALTGLLSGALVIMNWIAESQGGLTKEEVTVYLGWLLFAIFFTFAITGQIFCIVCFFLEVYLRIYPQERKKWHLE